jgi:hypothetical protein
VRVIACLRQIAQHEPYRHCVRLPRLSLGAHPLARDCRAFAVGDQPLVCLTAARAHPRAGNGVRTRAVRVCGTRDGRGGCGCSAAADCGSTVLQRCNGPSPGADVGRVGPVRGSAQSRRRCGRDGPSPGADVGGREPSPGADVAGGAQSRCRCGQGWTQTRCKVSAAGRLLSVVRCGPQAGQCLTHTTPQCTSVPCAPKRPAVQVGEARQSPLSGRVPCTRMRRARARRASTASPPRRTGRHRAARACDTDQSQSIRRQPRQPRPLHRATQWARAICTGRHGCDTLCYVRAAQVPKFGAAAETHMQMLQHHTSLRRRDGAPHESAATRWSSPAAPDTAN